MSKRVKLNVEEPGGVDRPRWPITRGVPFPDRELERGMPVRVVDSAGNVLPTQYRCLATWDKDMRYVKWLLTDFQADLKANETSEFFLEYGAGVESVAPAQAVSVQRVDKNILIATGALELALRDGDPRLREGDADFFKHCRIRTREGWRDVFRSRPGPFLYMADQHGGAFDSYAAAPRPVIIVEESGPLRASVCIKGYHASQDGRRFCPFILRIHLYAGKSDLRFHHTFVFDQNPDLIELSSVGMKFPLDLGDDLRMAFGGETQPHVAQRQGEASLLQRSDRDYTATRDGRPFGSGAKARGWASLAGNRASAVLAVRNLWQEHPKGVSLHDDGTLDVQIWPAACGENLVFWTPYKEEAARFGVAGAFGTPTTRDEEFVKKRLQERPTAPLNLKSFNIQNEEELKWVEAMIEKYAPDRPASHNDTGVNDGTGAAKTTEFLLRLSAEVISDDESDSLAVSVQEPVVAPPDAAYTCATGVFGPFQHKGDPRFAELDRGLDDILKLYVVAPREPCRLYGMMRYGNMVCSHSAGVGVAYRYYRDRDPSKALCHVGPYNNEANDQVYAIWCNFVRTGERKHFLLAEAYSQCVADVAICHAHPSHPEAVGLIHYHNAHQWSGGHSPSHTLISGILLHYYFTGNRRLLDVALEVADWAVRWQEPCGIISNRQAALHREITGPLWCVIEAYKATWAPKYGDLARRTLNWFLKTQPKPGDFPVSVYTRGDLGDEAWVEPAREIAVHQGAGGIDFIFREGMRLFPGEALRKAILAEADHVIWDTPTSGHFTRAMAKRMLNNRSKLWPVDAKWYRTQWGGPSLTNNAGIVHLAYEFTGDPLYAAWAKYMAEVWFPDYAERLRRFCPCLFSSIASGATVPIVAATAAEALRKDPEGLANAENLWRKGHVERGNPVYDGPVPGIPIDYEHFDANGGVISMPPADIELPVPEPRPEPRSIGRLDCETPA